MKLNIIFILLIFLLIPTFSQDYKNAGMDYTKALLTKPNSAKIKAFKDYVQKYNDLSKKFTKLSYFQLTSVCFNEKSYADAKKYGEKGLTIMVFSINPNEVTKINLILGNLYGIKSTPYFNKDKALQYTNKSIEYATKSKDKQVLSAAKNLKKQLSGPPPKVESPIQKFLRLYSDGSYSSAISQYGKLPSTQKSEIKTHLAYAKSLEKAGRNSSALSEYKKIYSVNKKASYALNIAKIYEKQKKYDLAIDYNLDASILFKNNKQFKNKTICENKAKLLLQKKYNYAAAYKKTKSALSSSKSNKDKNAKLIKRKQLELRRANHEKKKMEVQSGIAAPPHMTSKIKKLEQEIKTLKAGKSTTNTSSKEYEDFQKLKIKVEAEYKKELADSKERIKNT